METIRIRQALRRSGLGAAPAIPTFTSREELETLFHLAEQCPIDARALEIGSYLGASTCFIAAGLRGPRATIVCVDTWQNETMPEGTRDTFEEFKRNIAGVNGRVQLIRKRSSEVTADELRGPFDLVFLDGDHSYRGTKTDFELAAPLVAAAGVIAFHDARYWEGVSRVIGEALAGCEWRMAGITSDLLWLARADFKHSAE